MTIYEISLRLVEGFQNTQRVHGYCLTRGCNFDAAKLIKDFLSKETSWGSARGKLSSLLLSEGHESTEIGILKCREEISNHDLAAHAGQGRILLVTHGPVESVNEFWTMRDFNGLAKLLDRRNIKNLPSRQIFKP